MAKKNNIKKESPIKKANGYIGRTIEFLLRPDVKFVVGIILAALSVFLCSSFISFFASGGGDQTVVEAMVNGDFSSEENVGNTSGKGGAIVASYLVNSCFGWASLFMLPLLLFLAVHLMRLREVRMGRWTVIFSFGMIWGSLFFAFVFGEQFGSSHVSPGGRHGDVVTSFLIEYLGVVGAILFLLVSMLIFMIYVSRDTINWIQRLFRIKERAQAEPIVGERAGDDTIVTDLGYGMEIVGEADDDESYDDEEDEADENDEDDTDDVEEGDDELASGDTDSNEGDGAGDEPEFELEIDGVDYEEESVRSEEENFEESDSSQENDNESGQLSDDELASRFDAISMSVTGAQLVGDDTISMQVEAAGGDTDMGGDMLRPINPKDELSYYKPPTLDLLDEYETTAHSIDKDEQAANANRIVEVLKNFGIDISSIKATVGPTITLYEITPAPGVRISKIRNLEDDIAMSLSALCIRIVAPIPGKGTIGIEVPNAHKQIVPMASLLNSRKYKETDMALPLALGKTISNEVYMVDMAKMPHLLVAGATGMGKSVGLNAIITSLLYKMHPAYLKFVMVDPKMVELSLYGVLEKHFLAKLEGEDEPIITDVSKVVRTLKSLCVEMDNRYRLLQMASVRSVKEYNEKYLNKELLPTKGHRFMPYIVVIIDEYGDLMMTAGREVEQPIARIAQKARAVGIHMIIATQRPTTNIITGTIKANFPARMAFRVISVIDSRTILDRSGANQLQGRGDMLFLAGNDPVRVQCALVETKEVERVCAHIARQQGYQTAYILPEPDENSDISGEGGAIRGGISSDKLDPLFAEAARAVVITQQGSTSLIQRKFNVGFNRAGRIMDQLCQTGIVGEQEGSKPRQVLCSDESDLEFRLKSLL